MQQRAGGYPVFYDGFQEALRHNPTKLLWGYCEPDKSPIEDLHHHDVIEVGYCFSGNGIFLIDGESLPFSAPCATIIYKPTPNLRNG